MTWSSYVTHILTKILRRLTRKSRQQAMRPKVLSAQSFGALNSAYSQLSPKGRVRYHAEYAKIFSDDPGNHSFSRQWTVKLLNSELRLPVRGSHLWLDWDTATSILGHDQEIKESYLNLLKSDARPDLFIDIGANYGTHSLLFLREGVETITFEPNPACEEYFRLSCDLNGLTPEREAVALGSEPGETELAFLERDTWLGSAHPEVKQAFGPDVLKITVPVRTLDQYLDRIQKYARVLIKIDVEGLEEQVLRGAEQTIRKVNPVIKFESNEAARLLRINHILSEYGYRIYRLPWHPNGVSVMREEELRSPSETNFLALPQGY